MGAELRIDGSRPAVEWVIQLPRKWTATGTERLFLLLIALDTYDQEPPFEAAPSIDRLATWAGVFKDAIIRARDALSAPVLGVRPALLEVTKGTGRSGSTYRLCTEFGPALWPGASNHNDLVDNGSSVRERPTTSSVRERPTTSTRSVRASVRASGWTSPDTPDPDPYPYDSPSPKPAPSAHEDCKHKRYTVDGDCLDCHRQIFGQGAAS
jgi:hypothetical protein